MNFKKFVKRISAYVKADVKQQVMKELVAESWQFFYKKYFQYLKWNEKQVYIFHLILLVILSSLILSVKDNGWESFTLTNKIH